MTNLGNSVAFLMGNDVIHNFTEWDDLDLAKILFVFNWALSKQHFIKFYRVNLGLMEPECLMLRFC